MQPVKAVLLLLFWPSRFIALSVEHDIALEVARNKQLVEQFPNQRLPPERVEGFQQNSMEGTRRIRHAVFTALWSTALSVCTGFVIGVLFNSYVGRPPDWVISACQVAGAAIILAATLALLGWEIQSWKGQTLAEKANRWLFRAQYWAGTAVFVFSLFWSLVPQ